MSFWKANGIVAAVFIIDTQQYPAFTFSENLFMPVQMGGTNTCEV